jgi:beta-phosphoglucomutase family hydrolase
MTAKPVLNVLPGIKALIFDLDGTLADTMGTHFTAWSAAAGEFGFPFPYDAFLAHAGMPTRAILADISQEHKLDLDIEKIEAWKEKYFFAVLDTVRPVSIVDDVVRKYYGKLPMAIGTGSTRANAKKILNAMNYAFDFPVIVGADDVKQGKPNPETFLECARLLGVAPQDCQVFEDGQTGLDAAKAAGMAATDIRPYLS